MDISVRDMYRIVEEEGGWWWCWEQYEQATVVRGTAKVDGAKPVFWSREEGQPDQAIRQSVLVLQLCWKIRRESESGCRSVRFGG